MMNPWRPWADTCSGLVWLPALRSSWQLHGEEPWFRFEFAEVIMATLCAGSWASKPSQLGELHAELSLVSLAVSLLSGLMGNIVQKFPCGANLGRRWLLATGVKQTWSGSSLCLLGHSEHQHILRTHVNYIFFHDSEKWTSGWCI